MPFLSLITSWFLLIHKTLYHPVFPPLPIVRPFPIPTENTLTLPVKKLTGTQVPPVQAGAFLVIDRDSAEVLAESNADVELPPASTTKIMTAVVVLENMELDEVLTVPEDLPHEGSVMKLVAGERIRVRDVLTGLLVHSSNDAAVLLARSYGGGEAAFAQRMNEKANKLGMTHTHYENSSGLPDPRHVTTVRDLLILARYAMKNETFAAIVRERVADPKNVDGTITHHVETTNKLLGEVEGVEGIKTGWTEEAGECLVTQVTRDGHTILTALLRSPDRFAETKRLIAWVYDGYMWETKSAKEWGE